MVFSENWLSRLELRMGEFPLFEPHNSSKNSECSWGWLITSVPSVDRRLHLALDAWHQQLRSRKTWVFLSAQAGFQMKSMEIGCFFVGKRTETTFVKGKRSDTRWWQLKDFLCLPLLGEMIQFDEHIFKMGWNHQLGCVLVWECGF